MNVFVLRYATNKKNVSNLKNNNSTRRIVFKVFRPSVQWLRSDEGLIVFLQYKTLNACWLIFQAL